MKIENKTTSAASSVQTKPTSQKPSSEVKKAGPPVTAEKPSATPEKISTEDKYEKETKSAKKEEFFDNVSNLRSMSEKDSLKKEEKPEKLDKEKERKNLITSILSVSRDALRVAQSAIDKLSSCGDNMPYGKGDDGSDPYSVINKAALEVPEDTKKLWDNLFVLTAAEVKDNAVTSEKKGEEKLAEGTAKELQDKHEELRVEEKVPQTTYDPGKESEVLNNAMAGWGANKEAIYNVLKGKNPEELKALKESYKEKYGKDLEEVVKSELKGGDLDKAKALLEKGKLSEADNIKQSLDSWSIRKGDMVKILDGKTPEEIKAIKEEYKKTCGTELDEDLNKTLLMSPIEKEKIELLMNGEPQADMNIKDPKEREKELLKRKGEFTASKIELDIKALMSVPPPPKSYETKALLDTLYGKSPEEIKAYKDAYKKATGKDLEKTVDILLLTSPSNRAIAKSYMTQGKETDAEKLHRAMAGAGTSENLIFKTLEGKSDAERKAIIEDYKKKYGKDLMDDLKGDLGGAELTKAKALLEKGPCYQVGTDKIPPDKLKTIDKSLLNREFTEKELREKLTKSGLNEEEIEGILKRSKKDNLDTNTKLDIAMDRWGADKQAIFDTLQEASPETRQEILNNKEMMKKLEGELNDKDYAQAMGYLNSNQSGEVPLKDKLKSSMAGWGTDKNSFYEALDKASPEEIASLKNDSEMKKLFDSELNKEDREKLNNIIKEGKVSAKIKIKNSISFTGEDEKKIYEVLENASPEERKKLMNDPEIKEIFSKNLDSREMSNVNLIMEKGKLPARTKIEQACKGAGTDGKAIYEALEKATPEERKELMKDPSFKKMMEEELGGNALLRAQILLEKGKTEPVDDLYMAMKGAGTDEEAIFKALSSCKTDEEKDNLIKTYRNKYGRDLQADLKGEISTSEYYKAFDMLQKEPKTMEERKEQMTEKLSRERNSGDLWTNASNNIMDVFSDEGRNLDDSERELRDTYKQIEHVEKQGGKVDEKLLEKLDKAENKVKTNIEDYEESKNKVADGLSTAASITLAVATSIAITVGTGGAGAVTVPLIIGSALTCATTKVGINKLVKGNSYDLNSGQALTDFTTGAVEGALNVVGGPLVEKFAKLSGPVRTAVLQTIMKNPVVAQALKNSTIEGVASFMGNKAVQEIMTNAISDAVTTGFQGGLTTAMDDNTWSDGIGEGLLRVGESGAVQGGVGLATSVAMGTTLKAGEHILGKLKPKADTIDGLEVKLKDPEKFSKAKEILSEGSHSEAELTRKLKEVGFKDEDIQSVLEHKNSSMKKTVTEEPSVKEVDGNKWDEAKDTKTGEQVGDVSKIGQENIEGKQKTVNETKLYEVDEYVSDEVTEADKINARRCFEIANDIKSNHVRPGKIELENGIEIDFYGNTAEKEWLEEAIAQMPAGMKENLNKLIREKKGIKDIIIGDGFIYDDGNGNILKTIKGLCRVEDGQIILNRKMLNKNLPQLHNTFTDSFTDKIKHINGLDGNNIKEISNSFRKHIEARGSLSDIDDYIEDISESINENTKKMGGKITPEIEAKKVELELIKKYKSEAINTINETKNNWINTFNHELSHQFDYDFRLKYDISPVTEEVLLEAQKISEYGHSQISNERLDEIKKLLQDKVILDKKFTYAKIRNDLQALRNNGLTQTEINNILARLTEEPRFKYKAEFRLSEAENSPFLHKNAHEITSYAKRCQDPTETAAETLKMLLLERRKFVVTERLNIGELADLDDNKFIQILRLSKFSEQYDFIIRNYLTKNNRVEWPEFENYLDYQHLIRHPGETPISTINLASNVIDPVEQSINKIVNPELSKTLGENIDLLDISLEGEKWWNDNIDFIKNYPDFPDWLRTAPFEYQANLAMARKEFESIVRKKDF